MKSLYVRDRDDPEQLWMSTLTVHRSFNTIADRGFISEPIYREPMWFRLDQLMYLSLLNEVNSGIMFILHPPLSVIKKRWEEIGDDPWDYVHQAWKRYEQLRTGKLEVTTKDLYQVNLKSLLPSGTHWFTYPVLPQGVVRVMREEYARALKVRIEYRNRWCGVGSLTPDVLFLTDRVNPKVSRDPKKGPLTPSGDNSIGAYFMRMLFHSGLKNVHVHNAYTPKGTEYPEMFSFLEPRVVVGMGQEAIRYIQKHRPDAKIVEFYHPQYLRRFKAHEEKFWGGMLYDTVNK
jgi:hypothetical protein